MAEESVQPVPCVFEFSIRSDSNQLTFPSIKSRSSALSLRWPPFRSTLVPAAEAMRSTAASISAFLSILTPLNASPSGTFGVITSANGNSSVRKAWLASSCIRLLPLVATMTGSTTIFSALYSISFSAMTLMIAAFDTMPIFTASGRISLKTQSSCCATNSGVTSMIPATPVVFCAVNAVITLIP